MYRCKKILLIYVASRFAFARILRHRRHVYIYNRCAAFCSKKSSRKFLVRLSPSIWYYVYACILKKTRCWYNIIGFPCSTVLKAILCLHFIEFHVCRMCATFTRLRPLPSKFTVYDFPSSIIRIYIGIIIDRHTYLFPCQQNLVMRLYVRYISIPYNSARINGNIVYVLLYCTILNGTSSQLLCIHVLFILRSNDLALFLFCCQHRHHVPILE